MSVSEWYDCKRYFLCIEGNVNVLVVVSKRLVVGNLLMFEYVLFRVLMNLYFIVKEE